MDKKLLLVTFPVDLGNATFETRLVKMFENAVDLKVYRFVPNLGAKLNRRALMKRRLLTSLELWKEVQHARKEGRKILFHGISPALFAYPVTPRHTSFIVTDWTRKLYEPIWNYLPSPPWLTYIHKRILSAQKSVIGFTDAIVEVIEKDYSVPRRKLKKGRMPFAYDLNLFVPSPARQDDEIRILFVGGDLYRKGGDVLLQWFTQQNNPNLRLTLVTKSSISPYPGVTIETNIEFGQSKHIELFSNHDIFVLPTHCDSYPSVLGEAACSGLAVLTTQYAFGAPEIIRNGVNGYICNSSETLLDQLSNLVKDKSLVESMKQKSRELMEQEFAHEVVLREFVSYLFEE